MEDNSPIKNYLINANRLIENIGSRTTDRKIKSLIEAARKNIFNAGEDMNDPSFLHKVKYARDIVKNLMNMAEIKNDRGFMTWASLAISQLNACIHRYNENKDDIAA